MPFVLKRVLFRLHWILGLSAGLFLVVIGVTGGLIGFEKPLLALINPQLSVTAPAHAKAAGPDAWLAAARKAHPGLQPRAVEWNGPEQAVMVRMGRPGQRRGGEQVAINPYTGQILAPVRGEGFFHGAEQLHRNLTAGEVGKQLVGASTAALVLLALSGLILRWPRQMRSLRAWLALDTRLEGRNFLWHLHAVVGTWVLVFYLMAGLTGLWWSYSFYRNAINHLAGVQGRSHHHRFSAPSGQGPWLSLDAAWASTRRSAPDANRIMLTPSRDAGKPLQVRYLTTHSPHERAWNLLSIDARSGAITQRQLWAEKPRGQRFVGALFPLHSGSYFGRVGLYLMSLASLGMPLFFITGVWLWLKRRRSAGQARRERDAMQPVIPHGEPVHVFFASQSGTAERLAWATAHWLRDGGQTAQVHSLGALDRRTLAACRQALLVVASYGDGGPPDNALRFVRRFMGHADVPELSSLRYAVLALGNRRYDAFCGFGRRLDTWLEQAGAHALFPAIEYDEGDTQALHRWRTELSRYWEGVAEGDIPASHIEPAAAMQPWRIVHRQHLNPGSDGDAVWAIELEPPQGADARWQPGDLLDVRVAPSDSRISACLDAWAQDGDTPVTHAGAETTLYQALQYHELPRHPTRPAKPDAQRLLDGLAPLSARSYSIASASDSPHVRLLLRVGAHGLASRALVDADIMELPARVRHCPRFHAPAPHVPLIMIANGVGIAPFLGLLHERGTSHDAAPAWLVHGERHAQCDHYAQAMLKALHARGVLAVLDTRYSRDGDGYVQQALADDAERLRAWLQRGAHIMVCGSPAMGEGVHMTLETLLGAEALDALHTEGRYRRELF
ncbi:sulfite reductase flavoprotein subunit alpha [Oleiagrimonas sp. C23AA]|uniref:sulfite reductase flavoprotein subunit alpha n=1 Tax=Oleiagrimonas sp. C23AA TaxID=2719047 RepID=UPI00142329BC|nr:sulfite reductase flavoprotein subunit alpha [Oleiagrimonas sp. C23AA]NII10058.1 hypothetical protein [Oleiagrimonas sp. C23AA]